MNSLQDTNITSTEKDIIADAMRKIRDFWNAEGKPDIDRVDSTIKINNIVHHIVISSNKKKLNLIILP